jgi:hypothetical protein
MYVCPTVHKEWHVPLGTGNWRSRFRSQHLGFQFHALPASLFPKTTKKRRRPYRILRYRRRFYVELKAYDPCRDALRREHFFDEPFSSLTGSIFARSSVFGRRIRTRLVRRLADLRVKVARPSGLKLTSTSSCPSTDERGELTLRSPPYTVRRRIARRTKRASSEGYRHFGTEISPSP